jgi:RNA pseudouridylate synthase
VPGRGADKQDCLWSRVRCLYPNALVVHRLDMATSGLCLMARGARMQRLLSDAFAQRRVGKRYVAVVAGQPAAAAPHEWSLIDLQIAADWPNRPLRVIDAQHGKASQTRWRVLSHAMPPRIRPGWNSSPSPGARTNCGCTCARLGIRPSATLGMRRPRFRPAARACCCTPANCISRIRRPGRRWHLKVRRRFDVDQRPRTCAMVNRNREAQQS